MNFPARPNELTKLALSSDSDVMEYLSYLNSEKTKKSNEIIWKVVKVETETCS